MSRVVCRWCGADPANDPKIALARVNEKGVIGIWECVPYCIPDRLEQAEKSAGRTREVQ